MGLDGGGGGGGILGVGGAYTGSAQALEIIGEHAYAYNNLGASTTSASVMSFTTGNYYFVGTMQFNMPFNYGSPADSVGYLEANLNGGVVCLLTVGNLAPDANEQATQELIIPPYTLVEINIKANGNVPDRLSTVILTGRIYR